MHVAWKSCRAGLAAVGISMLTATANADPSAASRLMFDPGALERGQLGADPDSARRPLAKPAGERAAQGTEQIWTSSPLRLPSFDNPSLGAGLAGGSVPAKRPAAEVGANLFEQRVTFGNLSIGLETETSIKQRSLSGDGDKDPERDTILDLKPQRGFLPFIGLSAKSSLQ